MEKVRTRVTKKEKTEKIKIFTAMQGNPREAALMGYLAGIMDGEGTIGIKKYLPLGDNRSICYFVYLSMGMQFQEIPLLFQEVFGGSCTEERVPNQTSMWRWNVTGKEHVEAVINVLLPNLREKKQQAELALHCCRTWELQERRGRHLLRTNEEELLKREDAYQQMRKLKRQKHPQRLNELTLETVKR